MENVVMSQVQYTFKEKYFQVEPEGRVRRYQYFVRMLIPGILLGLCVVMLLPILVSIIFKLLGGMGGLMMIVIGGVIFTILYQLIYLIIFYKTGITTITKRCHDFGSDGKLAVNIFKIQLLVSVISMLLGMVFLGAILGEASFAESLGAIIEKYNKVSQILGVAVFIMGIILLFRPGNKGDNAYGKDPVNTKVSFLG